MKVSTYLSPGCTAFSHINGFHFPRVGNTSSTFPSRRSTPFPTNGRPSVNQPFFSDSPAGSHSAWSQAESLCSPLLLLVGCTAIKYLLTRASSHVRQDAKLPSTPVGSGLGGRSQAKRSPKDSAKSRAEKRRERFAPRAPPKIPSPRDASQ
ncbi:hypothetical protein AVEN_60370-1 [Araneus ventricosus]|uniref:Uncharacterized protein n=1 Tax=Araneus ventricosus TaxID=182803 RepID=A0A4Y2MIG6_ARAVE|nr:hypothetical protein AVEN_60370-1 [Araneus ventricosus]